MKDINVHRQRKINIFKRDISELEEEISKLREYLEDEDNKDMWYYYETHIDEKVKKVDELKEHIKNITDRIEGKMPEKKE